MDLLEFAVQRKLDYQNELLDYVAKDEHVPVHVLASSLEGVIDGMEDERASLLVSDYTEMMSAYVPMTYQRDRQTGEYTVEGEIDENILDSIQLVHGIDSEAAISGMIESNVETLTDTEAEVNGLDLNLSELEESAAMLNTQQVYSMSNAPEPEPFEAPVQEAQPEAETTADETLDDADIDAALGSVEPEQSPVQAPEETQPNEAEMSDATMAEKMKNAYYRTLDELKAKGLDKSLGLSL